MPTKVLPGDPLQVVLTQLNESHDVSAYEAVERLVQSAEAAGFDNQTLLRMLDQRTAFQQVLDLIVSKANCSQKAA